jgi:transposase
MFKSHVQDQGELFPPRIGELIPDDDLCRVVSEVVNHLDLTAFAANYSPLGQHAYSPRTMLKLLYFGYAQGVRSSRAIEDKVLFDVRYRWLAGADRPCKSVIAEFRTRNLAAIEDSFIQVVLLCRKLGMVRFGHWAIDGSRIKANAGKNALRRRESIEAELATLREQIRQAMAEAEAADADDPDDEPPLPPDIRHKQDRERRLQQAMDELNQRSDLKRANTTDPDAPLMKRKGGGFEPGYSPQLTVDADSQVVLAADVCTDQTDYAQLIPQLDQAQSALGQPPAELSADTGYATGPNMAAVADRGITGYIPPNQDTNRPEGVFQRTDFRYEPEQDRFVCPAGKPLPYTRTRTKPRATGGHEARVYKCTECAGCEFATRCLKPGAKTRSIEVSAHDGVLTAMRERLSTQAGREAYAKRKQSVEPVFGTVKWVMGFRSFLLRGLQKVKGEWRIATTAFNIRKIHTSGKLTQT